MLKAPVLIFLGLALIVAIASMSGFGAEDAQTGGLLLLLVLFLAGLLYRPHRE